MPDTSDEPQADHVGEPPETEPKASRWAAPMVLAVVLGAIVVSQTLLNRGPARPLGAPPDPAAEGVVLLAIDTGEGEPASGAVAWQDGMSVLDALERAPLGWPGPIDYRGAGANAFVTQIKGIANEGAGGRNWEYTVNGERGEVSAGVREVAAGDRILWKFTEPE